MLVKEKKVRMKNNIFGPFIIIFYENENKKINKISQIYTKIVIKNEERKR